MDNYHDEGEVVDLDGMFPFMMTEKTIVDEVILSVRSLLQRPELPPEDISRAAKLLFALERLPNQTHGVNISLYVGIRHNGESLFHMIRLTDDEFELGYSGNTSSEFGSDSFSSSIFELRVGEARFRSDVFNLHAISDWLQGLSSDITDPGQIVEFYDYTEEFDWEQEREASGWSQIERCRDFYG